MKATLAIVFALTLSAAAEAQEDELWECLRRGYVYCIPPTPLKEVIQLRKEIQELEERIKRERETPIGERITKPTETPEQRLERMRRELRNLRPLYCETIRGGRWVGVPCWQE
jgi:hypothetical protein